MVDGRDGLVELGSVQETYSLIVANHWGRFSTRVELRLLARSISHKQD
jgi:hypothetical protein